MLKFLLLRRHNYVDLIQELGMGQSGMVLYR